MCEFWDGNSANTNFPEVQDDLQVFWTSQILSGVYTSNLLHDLEFYLGQILSFYEAKYLGQIFSQTFRFTEGQYLVQIKLQIV